MLARDAGFGRGSFISALAGTLAAYGASVMLIAVAAGVGARIRDEGTSLSNYNWNEIGWAAALVLAGILFLSYLFGGYVAGRMARRAGALNGFLVFVLGLVIAAGAAAAVGTQTDGGRFVEDLRRAGVPTTGDEWKDIATVAGIASLAAMFVGSLLGGALGERWHGKLLTRALDPELGPEAAAREAETDARLRREDRERPQVRLAHRRSEAKAETTADDAVEDDAVEDDAVEDGDVEEQPRRERPLRAPRRAS